MGDSYFSLLNLSFEENNHICIFTTFAKQSMINRLSNPINRNRSAAKISKVMSSNVYPAPTKVLQNLIVIHKADRVYLNLKPTYHADLVLDNYNYPTRPFEHICIGSIILFHSCYQLLQRYP